MKKSIFYLFLIIILLIPTTIYGDNGKELPVLVMPIIPRKGVRISSSYGYRIHPITKKWSFHSGIDIAAPIKTPIHSIANGKVVFVKASNGTAGNEVRINHGNGIVSRYIHMHQRAVKVGDIVRVGQIIGNVGSTGRSTGPHLHFEIYKNGKRVNPTNIALGKF